jgi:GST-like protein
MLYRAEKSGKFMRTSLKGGYAAMQWLMFQMSGIGPMQGQAAAFERYFPEDVPAARKRYIMYRYHSPSLGQNGVRQ